MINAAITPASVRCLKASLCAAMLATLAVAGGCRSNSSRNPTAAAPEADSAFTRSSVTASARSITATCRDGRVLQGDVGRVRLTIDAQPVASAGAEARAEITSETEKSTVRFDAREGTLFEWHPGSYKLRVFLNGYRSVERDVTVGCLTLEELRIPMRR